jgi:hypothetical protein
LPPASHAGAEGPSSTEALRRWYNPAGNRQEENGMLLQEAGREIEELRRRLEQIADHL